MKPPSRSITAIAALILGAAARLAFAQADPLAQARSLLDAGKIADSETRLREFIAAHPDNAEAHFLLGYALFREQKARESLDAFTAGAKFRRPKADELKVVAADYVMLGDFTDADKWFTEVVAATPHDADAWYLLGRTRYNENKFNAAIDAFEHSLAERPRYVEAENNIGLAWKELNETEKAKAAFQNAIDWQGDSPADPQPFLNLGALLAETDGNDQAIPLLKKAISLAPNNPSAHEGLGKVYMAMNNLPDAQSELERAVALSPDASALHYKLGQVLRKQGLTERAQQEFAICERLNGAHSSSKIPNPPPPSKPAPNE
jgi:tetratricopeptide (TPR) repeat protein